MTILIFIIVLAVLIFVHELGHFIGARIFGVRVDAFKIGFGPRILYWKGKETEYGVNLIPFGGYVKIFGENPDTDSLVGHDAKRSFVNKSRWKQVLILGAGVLFNFIFAWILYAVVFASGVTISTSSMSEYSGKFENPRIIITNIVEDSPAEKAGLKEGDTIRYVENLKMNMERAKLETPDDPHKPVQTIEQIKEIIGAEHEKPISIEIDRKGNISNFPVIPVEGIVEGQYGIGIWMDNVVDLQLGIGASIYEGLKYTLLLIWETVKGLFTFLANIVTGSPNFSDVAGPVGIAGIVGNAAELGFVYLLMITALISINLGVINLVPFPALDGGRILFVLIEAAIRRRVPPKVANSINAFGFVLLMILMVVVTWKDISRLWN